MEQRDDISLRDIFLIIAQYGKYIISKWYILVFFIALGVVFGFFYAKTKPVVYEATTTFVLEGARSGGAGGVAGVASMLGLNIAGDVGSDGLFQGESLFELYKSRKVLENTLLTAVDSSGKELLVQRYMNTNSKYQDDLEDREQIVAYISDLKFFTQPKGAKLQRLRDSIMQGVTKNISENALKIDKPNSKANLIAVSITAEDEEFAKVFNSELVRYVNKFYLEVKTGRSRENLQILEYKVDSVKRVLNYAVNKGASIQDATPNLNPTRQSQRLIPQQESQISAEMNRTFLVELVRNLEMSKITLAKDAPLIKIVDDAIYPLKKQTVNFWLNCIAGGVLFLFLSLGFILGRRIFLDIMRENTNDDNA